MYARFKYLDGPHTGESIAVAADFATIGRHPTSDLTFDPDRELDVSVRHAAVFKQGGGFLVRDLGSTNGTFLNGVRIRGDRPLESGDVLRFGSGGPRVEFTLVDGLPATVVARRPKPTVAIRPTPAHSPIQPTTGERIRIEVERQTFRWKWLAGAAVGFAILVGGTYGWLAYRDRQRLEADRRLLLTRIDDLKVRLDRTSGTVSTLQGALVEARSQVNGLRGSVAAAKITPERLALFSREFETSAAEHRVVLEAARLDVNAIAARNGPAVALVLAQTGLNRVISATGFAIWSAGDTVLIITNRHVVQDSAGATAWRVGLIFNGTAQNSRAVVAQVNPDLDLALLAARIRGGAQPIVRLADSIRVGDPVAMIGFPDGVDLGPAAGWRTQGVSATTFAGTVAEVRPGRLAVDGYGTRGSSGSPVLNARGELVGVVFGGQQGANGRTVYAVPAAAVRQMVGRG